MTRLSRVAAWNSTVNGRYARKDHDARKWFDGWKNLALDDPAVYKDGHYLNGGEYLHVPLANDPECRWYRVRSRKEPGKKFRSGSIISISVEKSGSAWFWVIGVHEARRS